MKIQVFQEKYHIDNEADLRERLKYRHQDKYAAFWLCNDAPELGLLINGDKAFLYHMPPQQEGFMTSSNPDPKASEFNEIEFLIENYQMDLIPETMVVELADGIEAFLHFYRYGDLGNQINWN
jgi:hypothetical protein